MRLTKYRIVLFVNGTYEQLQLVTPEYEEALGNLLATVIEAFDRNEGSVEQTTSGRRLDLVWPDTNIDVYLALTQAMPEAGAVEPSEEERAGVRPEVTRVISGKFFKHEERYYAHQGVLFSERTYLNTARSIRFQKHQPQQHGLDRILWLSADIEGSIPRAEALNRQAAQRGSISRFIARSLKGFAH